MLTARIKIGSGQVEDTREYGLVYLSSDNRVGAGQKAYAATEYPEEEGEHIITRSVDAAFDYKVSFFMQADSLQTANAKIAAFNALLHGTPTSTGMKEYYKVEFYNDHKRQKIVGYPQEISEATTFWRDKNNQVNDVVVVDWTIRVVKPSECNFSAAE